MKQKHDSNNKNVRRSGNIYIAIVMCEHTHKTWMLYLKKKNKFANTFQAWFS